MRRFEQLLAKPVQFWEVAIEGREVRTREGVRGGDAVEGTKTLASDEAAKRHVDAAIAERKRAGFVEIKRIAAVEHEERVDRSERVDWGDGYVRRFRSIGQSNREVRAATGRIVRGLHVNDDLKSEQFTTTADATAHFEKLVDEARLFAKQKREPPATLKQRRTIASNPELEAHCFAAPDDRTPWAVYADWLIAQGDLRGEIAGLALGGQIDQAEGALEVHFADVFDARLEVTFALRHGFLHKLELRARLEDEPLPRLLPEVLGHPVCRFVDSLTLHLRVQRSGENDWAPALRALIDAPQAASLRHLTLDGWKNVDILLRTMPFGDLSFAWPRLTALASLRLCGGIGPIGFTTLSNLHSYTREPAMRPDELDELVAAPMPDLRELAFRCEERDMLEPLVGFAKRLHSLDLSNGKLLEADARLLAKHATKFRHLASLDLSWNRISDRGIAAVRAVLDNAIVAQQHLPQDDRYDEFEE